MTEDGFVLAIMKVIEKDLYFIMNVYYAISSLCHCHSNALATFRRI